MDDIPVKKILATIWLVILTLAVLGLLYELRHLFFDLVVATFLAIVLNAPVTWLRRRGMSRGPALGIVMIVLFMVIGGIGAAIATPLAKEAASVAKHAPSYLSQAEHGRGPIGRLAKRFHLERQLKRALPAVSRSLS